MVEVHRVPGARQITHAGGIEMVILLIALVAVVLSAASGAAQPSELPTTIVKTHSGDTPWGLAAAHPVEGLTTAETAALIVKMNGFDANTLPTGGSVRVPAGHSTVAYAMR